MKRGKKPAAELEPDDKPELFEDLTTVWHAFHDLSTSRPAGMSASGLPWVEVSRYAADHGIDGAERLRFCRMIRALDVVFLMEMAKRREASRGSNRPRDSGGQQQPGEGVEGSGPRPRLDSPQG